MATLNLEPKTAERDANGSGPHAVPKELALAAQADSPKVGGKGEGLIKLRDAATHVPPFFVIDARWLARSLEAAGSLPRLRELHTHMTGLDPKADAQALEAAAAEARTLIVGTPLPAALRAEVVRRLERIGEGPYAVRSSMVGEDSASHSFAGQLESFLFQNSLDEVCASIRHCWASAFSSRLAIYRARALARDLPEVGVVVQQMIDGQVSGVCFTADPHTGRRDRIVISAAYGLGEGVVNGTCNTDLFTTDHAGEEIDVKLADKDVAIVRANTGVGTQQIALEGELRKSRCLTREQVARIAQEAARIQEAFGAPQDIEWTLYGDALHILQSRPITTLPTPENQDGPRLIFDNSNIQESYCGVTTPLTFSFASRAYRSVYHQAFGALGVPRRVLAAYDAVFRNMLGLVHGRVYYNLNNWYRVLLLMPAFQRNKADMEKMMGVTEPVDFVEDEHLTVLQKLARIPMLVRTLVGLVVQIRALEKAVPAWIARFDAIVQNIDRAAFRLASFSELMAKKRRAEEEILGHWHTPIINDIYVMSATGKVRRLIAQAGFSESEGLESALLGGEEGIESVEPTRELMRIAALVRNTPGAADVIRNEKSADLLELVRTRFPVLAARIERYIERYGDRVIGELKLESISLREDASFLFDVVRGYLGRDDLDAEKLALAERARRDEAEHKLLSRLPASAHKRAKKVLKAARGAVKNRENMRLCRTRAFGLYRDIARALGERLYEAGRLDAPRDVFYITDDELEAYHEGRCVSADLASIARARKAEFAGYLGKELPHRFETVGPVYHGNRYRKTLADEVVVDARLLQGIGCSGGVVESEARVILSAQDELSVDGKILVTLRTDPGWAPLFVTCSGVLVERGSTLSHSAVVARELGIPAVVGVPDLLQRVKNGERIRLDGSTGRVERLDVVG
jgi:pyruvate,water dikinase